MSTRSTLTIKTDTTTINFYRHMDGYVSEAGHTLAQLIDKVAANNSWQHPGVKLAEEILKQQYKATKHRAASPIYELTNNPEGHSDREYHYEVTYSETFKKAVFVYVYDKSGKSIFRGNGHLDKYRDFVAKEVAVYQERVKAHEAKLAKEKENGCIANEEQTKSYGRRYGTITAVRSNKL